MNCQTLLHMHPRTCVCGALRDLLAAATSLPPSTDLGNPLLPLCALQDREHRRLHSNQRVAVETAQAISQLRLKDVAWLRDIPHPNTIQTAFIDIVANLERLRAFMPPVLLAQASSQAEDLGYQYVHRFLTRPSPRPRSSQSTQLTSHTTQPTSGTDSQRYRLPSSPSTSTVPASPRPYGVVLDTGLCVKKIAVAVVSLTIDPDPQSDASGGPAVLETAAQFVSLLLAGVTEHNGVMDFGRHPFEVVVHWNAGTACREPAVRAARCAWALHQQLMGLCRGSGLRVRHSIGVAVGQALCGNVGTDELRMFCAHGPCLYMAQALAAVAADRDLDPPVLLTDDVSSEVDTVLRFVFVDCVRHCHPSAAPHLVAQALEAVVDTSDEWMYHLQNIERDNVDGDINDAFKLWSRGKGGQAKQKLQHLLTNRDRVCYTRLQQLINLYPDGCSMIPPTVH